MKQTEIINFLLFLLIGRKGHGWMLHVIIWFIPGWMFSLCAQTVSTTFDKGIPEQNYIAEHWTLESGLPVNRINQIYQTPNGFIWMASLSGIIRFDGYRFQLFNVANTPGLPSNRIERIQPGMGNSFWLTSEQRELILVENGNFTLVSNDIGDNSDVFVDGDSLVWVTIKNQLYRYQDNQLQQFSPPNFASLRMRGLSRGKDGNLLIGNHPGQVLKSKYPYTSVETFHSGEEVSADILLEDSKGRIWSATNELFMHTAGNSLKSGDYMNYRRLWSGIPPFFFSVMEDEQGQIWVMSETGIFLADGETLLPIGEHVASGTPSLPVRKGASMAKGNDGSIWMVRGTNIYRNGQFQFYTEDPPTSIFCDKENNIWLSIGNKGISRYRTSPIRNYVTPKTSNNYYGVYADKFGRVWFGEWLYTLNFLDQDGRVKNFPTPSGWGNSGSFLETTDGTLHIGKMYCPPANRTDDGGCVAFLPIEGLEDRVFALLESENGMVWIGTDDGLYLYQSGKLHFQKTASDDEKTVRFLLLAKDNTIWMATNGGGIRNFHPQTKKVTHFDTDKGLSSNKVRALFEDENGLLWIATEDKGLNRLNPFSGEIRTISTSDGLYDDELHALQLDGHGRLWMSSNKGIFWVKFARLNDFMDQKVSSVYSVFYTERDGMGNREGNGGFQNASLKTDDGHLWFCTQEGVVRIQPDKLGESNLPLPVIIENIQSGDEYITSENGFITLYPSQNNFKLAFTSPAFSHSDHIQYRYKLEGFDRNWVENGSRNEAIYTNIPSGEYQFKVAPFYVWADVAANPTLLGIVKLPLFYETWWFRTAIILPLVLLGFMLYKSRTNQLKKRQIFLEKLVEERTRELEKAKSVSDAQSEKLIVLDKQKNKFFTNISHEFRTPLTLIIGPLENLRQGIGGESLSKDTVEQVKTAIKNSHRLLRLVEQLLDISKLEAGKFKIALKSQPINNYIYEISASFRGIAERKEINYQIIIPEEMIAIEYDNQHFDKIITNLISNAFKFTPSGGTIAVEMRRVDHSAQIEVRDSGIGISQEHLPFLFDRFYQIVKSEVQPGTGIGLALAKELTLLHKGEIKVHSEIGKGSKFILNFPIHPAQEMGSSIHSHQVTEYRPYTLITKRDLVVEHGDELTSSSDMRGHEDCTTILVVDDNRDIQNYLANSLKSTYKVIKASSGSEGMEKVTTHLPDIIISDIMMDDGDGLSFLHEIRSHPDFDFLPVILLTAKADVEDRLAGWQIGADDYITKPFKMVEVKARVENLLEQRKRLKYHFQTATHNEETANIHLAFPISDSLDKVYLENFFQVLKGNFMDEYFSVDKMAEAMHQSRSNLYRKIVDLTNETPSALLKKLRLERSEQLLKTNSGNISEVAYACGFNSVSHFSKIFREKYGVSPTSYISSLGNRNK